MSGATQSDAQAFHHQLSTRQSSSHPGKRCGIKTLPGPVLLCLVSTIDHYRSTTQHVSVPAKSTLTRMCTTAIQSWHAMLVTVLSHGTETSCVVLLQGYVVLAMHNRTGSDVACTVQSTSSTTLASKRPTK